MTLHNHLEIEAEANVANTHFQNDANEPISQDTFIDVDLKSSEISSNKNNKIVDVVYFNPETEENFSVANEENGAPPPYENSFSQHVNKKGIRLSWNNLSVTTIPKVSSVQKLFSKKLSSIENNGKRIIKSISGTAEPSSLLAIMGASGAGKTTLLNVLSRQNVKNLFIQGEVLVNNKFIRNKIKNISAYVMQEELFIGTLTVREHLLFQAYLRMSDQFSTKEKEKRVDDVILQLGLTKCQNTIIGVPGRIRGISGGENKRLSFASEIITDPQLLFVDEPTSGLDSFMAESVITCLQKIASEGTTIIATIHQPSSEVFQLFDRLLLLSEGRTAFLGKTIDAITFFNRVNFPCPLNYNPADHYVHTLAIIPGKEDECKARCNAICDAFEYENKTAPIDSQPIVINEDADTGSKYKVGFFTQLRTTLWRAWISNLREPYITKIRLMQNIVIAIIAGLVYLRVGDLKDNNDKVSNINGAIFFTVTTMSFGSITGSLFVFPAEIPVFLKEHKLGMYRTDVYFLSKVIAEFPSYLIGPILYSVIYYFMVGFRTTASAFFASLGILEILVQCALSFGYLVSAMSPSVQVATGVGPPLIMPFMLFGGFFLKDKSIPIYFIWLKWLSWFKYSAECLQIIQWHDYDGLTVCETNRNVTCFYPNGNAALASFGYSPNNMGRNIGLMFALIGGFRIAAFLFVLLRAYRAK
ncbi:protein white isoform X1 [Hydra vulgaris]|uniref:protein white isoform X1 n=1 Tax=Hydra vulgaris TaxID=6087 RepID=UPI001F5F7888|nr:protein white-like [Hydra vulgaris]